MAKEKATITLDRSKAKEAQSLTGASSTSEVIDRALDLLIRTERLRSDIAAYQRIPPTKAEMALALVSDTSGLSDDTDWEFLYNEDSA